MADETPTQRRRGRRRTPVPVPAEAEAPPAAETEPAAEATPAAGPPPGGAGLYPALWRTGLLNVGAIARRELGAYFVSPIAYVVGALLIIPVAFLGYLTPLASQGSVTMTGIYAWVTYLMVFLIPLFTMRLLAEERRNGTLEMLLTSPVRDWELVLGKWLGAVVFYLTITAFVVVFAVLLFVNQPLRSEIQVFGYHLSVANLDYGVILTGYLGLVLAGGAFVAIGLLTSSLTGNQIIAAFAGIVALVGLYYLMGDLSSVVTAPYSGFFDYASGYNRYVSFGEGRLVLKDVVYFLSLTLAALFVTTRVLESRKWR